MTYAETATGLGERPIFRAHRNPVRHVVTALIIVLGFLPIGVLLIGTAHVHNPSVLWRLAIGFSGACCLLAVIRFVRRTSAEIAVTSGFLVIKTGFIGRRIKEIALECIDDLEFRQSVWDRLSGSATVTLYGRPFGKLSLVDIDRPRDFHRAIDLGRMSMHRKRH